MPIKFEQKSFSHSTSSGDLSDEELTRRWEQTFGKRPEKPSAAERECHADSCAVDKKED